MWATVLVTGLGTLAAYGARPGHAAGAPQAWPAGVPVSRASGGTTVVALLHPECPCSATTVANLAVTWATPGRGTAHRLHLVFDTDRPGDDAGLASRRLVEQAERLSRTHRGVSVAFDPARAVAKSFGGRTSGQVVAYDAAGRRRFSGGVTAGRGHAGPNPGWQSLTALLDADMSTQQATAHAPVFGCPLAGPGPCGPKSNGGLAVATPPRACGPGESPIEHPR